VSNLETATRWWRWWWWCEADSCCRK